MFLDPTVLILGAGASVPYGFPTGQGLVNEILGNEESSHIRQRREAGFDDKQMDSLKEAITACQSTSIDAFLIHSPEHERLGRFLIAQRITAKYDYNTLFTDPLGEDDSGKWYRRLVNSLGDTPEDLKLNKLSIITFNYDLSLDFYLTNVIRSRHQCGIREAVERLEHIPIFHVHGTVGNLPWEIDLPPRYGYSQPTSTKELLKSAESLKVMRGYDKQDGYFEGTRRIIDKSEHMFLFGYGFHLVNTNRLGLDTCSTEKYASTYGITDAEHAFNQSNVRFLMGKINDGNIVAFMRNCQRYVEVSSTKLV